MIELAINIVHKVQSAGTPEQKDSWFIHYADRVPELVFVDPNTLAIFNEKLKYNQRRTDGVGAYLMLASEFRLSGNLRATNKAIENKLRQVRDELINGQWISALEELETVNTSVHFTQELYDRFHLSLSTYITNNY